MHTLRFAAALSFSLALATSSCTKAALLAAGEGCTSPLDCEPGLICTPGKDNAKRICASDLTGTGGTPAPMPLPDGASDSASVPDAVQPATDAQTEDALRVDAAPDGGTVLDASSDANDSG
jgi:hypothetical protein